MSLYKYTSAEIGFYILSQSKIRFSQPSAFNDPFDVFPYMDEIITDEQLREDTVDRIKSNPKEVIDLYNKFAQDIYHLLSTEAQNILSLQEFIKYLNNSFGESKQDLIDYLIQNLNIQELKSGVIEDVLIHLWNNVGILSLSCIDDNLLMWSHYADSHRGVVIEFDEQHPFLNQVDDLQGFSCSAVQYVTERPYLRIENGKRTLDKSRKNITDLFYVKSIIWEYEKEFRVIRFLQYSNPVINQQCGFNVHLFDLPVEIIKSVTFGCKISQVYKSKILELLKEKPEYHNVVIRQAKADRKHYKLII